MSVTPRVRVKVLDRDGWACWWCRTSIEGRPYSIHHRRPRGMGGSKRPDTDRPQNLLVLCGSGVTGCHGWIESNRAWAVEHGLIVRQGDDPMVRAVADSAGEWWWLDALGGRHPALTEPEF